MTDTFRAGWRRFWGAFDDGPAAATGFMCAVLAFNVVCELAFAVVKAIWTVTR